MVKLFSKNSNLCDHNSPTLQTDRQTDRQTDGETDDMRSQYRALHWSASRGKKLISRLSPDNAVILWSARPEMTKSLLPQSPSTPQQLAGKDGSLAKSHTWPPYAVPPSSPRCPPLWLNRPDKSLPQCRQLLGPYV